MVEAVFSLWKTWQLNEVEVSRCGSLVLLWGLSSLLFFIFFLWIKTRWSMSFKLFQLCYRISILYQSGSQSHLSYVKATFQSVFAHNENTNSVPSALSSDLYSLYLQAYSTFTTCPSLACHVCYFQKKVRLLRNAINSHVSGWTFFIKMSTGFQHTVYIGGTQSYYLVLSI